VSNVGEGKLS